VDEIRIGGRRIEGHYCAPRTRIAMADDAAAAAAPEVEDVLAAEPAGLTDEGASATELDAATKLRCVAAFHARGGEFRARASPDV